MSNNSQLTFHGTRGTPPLPPKNPAPSEVLETTPAANRKTNLREILQTFVENTTAHGIGSIARSKSLVGKVFWLTVFLTLLGLFCLQGSDIVQDYLYFPSATTVELITNTNLTFPSVTICNMNRFRRSKLPGTRLEKLIEVDGGLTDDRGNEDYAWFFDWDSDWYNEYMAEHGAMVNGTVNVSSVLSESVTLNPTAPGMDVTDDPLEASDMSTPFSPEEITITTGEPIQTPATGNPHRKKRSLPGSQHDSWNFTDEIEAWVKQEWNEDDYEGDEFHFYYDDDYDWDNIFDEDAWDEFYNQSTSPDYSDFISTINPTRQELKDLGHQAKNFILQCTYDKKECNYSDFYEFQNKEYGNCFTFNYNEDAELNFTTNSGTQYGLHLTLFLEMPEYIGVLSPEAGARVVIHSQTTPPYPEEDGITVAPGMATNIGLRQIYVERLGTPYSKDDCVPFTTESYSRKSCQKFCLQEVLYEKCNCVTDILLENKTMCSPINKTQQICKKLVEYLADNGKLDCKCPVPCNETTYVKSVSSSIWPSERYEEHLQKRLKQNPDSGFAAKMAESDESTRKNIVRLRVYFEELNYQSIRQSPMYTFPNLLGNVGGLLGLYLGVSFLTLVEGVELLFSIAKYLVRNAFCSRKVTPTAVA